MWIQSQYSEVCRPRLTIWLIREERLPLVNGRLRGSNVKAEMNDIAVFDDVVLTF